METKVKYIGDGKTKSFFFDFPFFQRGDIAVTINGEKSDIKYGLVTAKPNPLADIPYTGGTVQFATAPAAGAVIEIFREFIMTRPVDYQPNTQPTSVEMNLDANFGLENLKELYRIVREMRENMSFAADVEKINTACELIDSIMPGMGQINNVATQLTQITSQLEDIDAKITTADYVIASQTPTSANNYTWYRKYKSGWVEQGGRTNSNSSGEFVIQLPIAMASKGYQFIATFELGSNDKTPNVILGARRQTNNANDTKSTVAGITTYCNGTAAGYTSWPFAWRVTGIGA